MTRRNYQAEQQQGVPLTKRRRIITFGLFGLASLLVPLAAGAGVRTASQTIRIENTAFNPTRVTIKVGDSVTWVNKDPVPHTATADDGSFDLALLGGESASRTFNAVGSFSFYCRPHPWMIGVVRVVSGDPNTLPETGDEPGGTLPVAALASLGAALVVVGVVVLKKARAT